MAMLPKDMPITRADVAGWIASWKRTAKAKRPPIEDYIRAKVATLDLEDDQVVTLAHENFGDTTPVADMIIADLPSYGVSVSS